MLLLQQKQQYLLRSDGFSQLFLILCVKGFTIPNNVLLTQTHFSNTISTELCVPSLRSKVELRRELFDHEYIDCKFWEAYIFVPYRRNISIAENLGLAFLQSMLDEVLQKKPCISQEFEGIYLICKGRNAFWKCFEWNSKVLQSVID